MTNLINLPPSTVPQNVQPVTLKLRLPVGNYLLDLVVKARHDGKIRVQFSSTVDELDTAYLLPSDALELLVLELRLSFDIERAVSQSIVAALFEHVQRAQLNYLDLCVRLKR